MDDNIDILNDITTIDRCRNQNLKDLRNDYLIENSVSCMNTEPSFFRRGKVSYIDHIYTSSPQYIEQVST